MINGFPKVGDVGGNPAIQLFGHRFFSDQNALDLLSEFLLLVVSKKHIDSLCCEGYFPESEQLRDWREQTPEALLRYEPKAKLNLKLFAFLSSSTLESRHLAHREHAIELNRLLQERIDATNSEKRNQAIKTLSNLLRGFWGTGAQRTWCAQTFLPFCEGVLGGEVIWNETEAKKRNVFAWNEVLDSFATYFSQTKHVIFCQGGSALYLQLCNALSRTPEEVAQWLDANDGGGMTAAERDPAQLRAALCEGFRRFFGRTPPMLNQLINFIDTSLEPDTAAKSDADFNGAPRQVSCGWVPEEGWREGYLFAVELSRLLSQDLGIMECVELLGIGCALQEMRSLAAQSYRHSATPGGRADGLDYRLLICDSTARGSKARDLSQRSLAEVTHEIQQVIRTADHKAAVTENYAKKCGYDQEKTDKKIEAAYKDADARYGFKLYRKVGKSIGLIVPPKGAPMRCTLNDKLIRYLTLSLIPQERMTLDAFKRQMEFHHGFVFEGEALAASRNWKGQQSQLGGGESALAYLEHLLEASGVLVHLSDACSLVKNPYAASASK